MQDIYLPLGHLFTELLLLYDTSCLTLLYLYVLLTQVHISHCIGIVLNSHIIDK